MYNPLTAFANECKALYGQRPPSVDRALRTCFLGVFAIVVGLGLAGILWLIGSTGTGRLFRRILGLYVVMFGLGFVLIAYGQFRLWLALAGHRKFHVLIVFTVLSASGGLGCIWLIADYLRNFHR